MMKRNRMYLSLIGLCFILVACANPLNRATYDRYREQGIAAEAKGDWATAEIAYYRAAKNVELGHLGAEFKADALYDLGRTKWALGKFEEAEELLKKSLTLTEEVDGADSRHTFYPIGELAATYYYSQKYEEGVEWLIRLESIIENNRPFLPQAERAIKNIYQLYSDEMLKAGRPEEAARFKKVADSF